MFDQCFNFDKTHPYWELHRSASTLNILIRSYRSYLKIIDRILNGPKLFGFPREYSMAYPETGPLNAEINYLIVSEATRSRFEELRDHLAGFHLFTLSWCLEEQVSPLFLTVGRRLLGSLVHY